MFLAYDEEKRFRFYMCFRSASCVFPFFAGQELRTFGPDQVDPFGKRRHNAMGLGVGTRVSRGNQDATQDVWSGEHRRGFQTPKEEGQPGIKPNHHSAVHSRRDLAIAAPLVAGTLGRLQESVGVVLLTRLVSKPVAEHLVGGIPQSV